MHMNGAASPPVPAPEPGSRTRAEARAAWVLDEDLQHAKHRLGAAMPLDGWLGRYLRAVSPLTDTPVEFSLIAGMSALATAMGNSVWIETWGQRVYPHLWSVLVAPSSFWRKSTAINLAERLLVTADHTLLLPSDFSKEKLLEELSARPVGLLSIKEFGGFLATMGREYMSGTREMLTDLYDSPLRYTRALKSRTFVIESPAINILGATTLDWLEAKMTEGDIRGGFMGRFLWVTAAEKSSPKGLTGAMDGVQQFRLMEGIRELRKVEPGRVWMVPPAQREWESWMATFQAEVERGPYASSLSGFAVRLQTYALKFAMVHQASLAVHLPDDPDEPIPDDRPPLAPIGEEAMHRALAYCRHMWVNVRRTMGEDIAVTKEAKDLRRVREMVPPGGITHSALLKASHMGARTFEAVIETLKQTGEVHERVVTPSEIGLDRKRQRQTKVYQPGAFPTADAVAKASQSRFPGAPPDPGNREPDELMAPDDPLDIGNRTGEPYGPDPSGESLTTHHFTHTPHTQTHTPDSGGIRAGAREANRKPEPTPDEPPAPVDGEVWS